jgi:hypothetical protein
MKRTIAWPPVISGGRMKMTEAPSARAPLDAGAALRQVIRLALLDGTSGNPWNGAAGTPDQAFRSNDPATRARLRSRVHEVFRRLERTKRAKLIALTFPRDALNPASLIVRIEYSDLESGGRQDLEIAANG